MSYKNVMQAQKSDSCSFATWYSLLAIWIPVVTTKKTPFSSLPNSNSLSSLASILVACLSCKQTIHVIIKILSQCSNSIFLRNKRFFPSRRTLLLPKATRIFIFRCIQALHFSFLFQVKKKRFPFIGSD